MNKKNAFSIIELIIVLVFMCIIATILYTTSLDNKKEQSVKQPKIDYSCTTNEDGIQVYFLYKDGELIETGYGCDELADAIKLKKRR